MAVRRVPWLLVFVLFVGMPVLEIYVLVQVGQVIGAAWTVLLLVAAGVLGTWLARREGRRAWRAFDEALAARRVPARELADGALILVGGTMLLAPGFVSDVLGMALIVPPTRAVFRGLLTAYLARRFTVVVSGGGPRYAAGDHEVVPGEVVE
jgi:UPF0716 protein FxsA